MIKSLILDSDEILNVLNDRKTETFIPIVESRRKALSPSEWQMLDNIRANQASYDFYQKKPVSDRLKEQEGIEYTWISKTIDAPFAHNDKIYLREPWQIIHDFEIGDDGNLLDIHDLLPDFDCSYKVRMPEKDDKKLGKAYCIYRANTLDRFGNVSWLSSATLPQELQRVTIEITSISPIPLQEIKECNAIKSGATANYGKQIGIRKGQFRTSSITPLDRFILKWDNRHKDSALKGIKWEDNPWVWDVNFKIFDIKKGDSDYATRTQTENGNFGNANEDSGESRTEGNNTVLSD